MKRLQTPHLRAWIIRLAMASLLLVQSLGVLHGVAHAPRVSATQDVQSAVGLFAGHHSGDVDCRLFDQLTHADLASLPVSALPCGIDTAVVPQTPLAGHLPATERHYSARGPPALA